MYKACKDSKDQGGFHDFVEILKLYDKNGDDTMIGNELFRLLTNLGEKLIKALASSLVSFSPRFVRRRNSSFPIMVSSPFLSYSFRISTKSWKPPWSLESLQALYMGKMSALPRNLAPLACPPPISLMVFRVGFRLQARMRSPA